MQTHTPSAHPTLPGARVDRLLALGMGEAREHARQCGLQMLPAQVEDGLRVQADGRALWRALQPLMDQVLSSGPTDAALQWRAIRQGARACISLRVLPAREQAWALHLWLPLAPNDPLNPEPTCPTPAH